MNPSSSLPTIGSASTATSSCCSLLPSSTCLPSRLSFIRPRLIATAGSHLACHPVALPQSNASPSILGLDLRPQLNPCKTAIPPVRRISLRASEFPKIQPLSTVRPSYRLCKRPWCPLARQVLPCHANTSCQLIGVQPILSACQLFLHFPRCKRLSYPLGACWVHVGSTCQPAGLRKQTQDAVCPELGVSSSGAAWV